MSTNWELDRHVNVNFLDGVHQPIEKVGGKSESIIRENGSYYRMRDRNHKMTLMVVGGKSL